MHKNNNNNNSGAMKEELKSSSTSHEEEVMGGSDLKELVENEKVFIKFVDHKFEELDVDCDSKLSVRELQPAVADIGLPAQGTSPDSDNICTEELNECTRGKQKKVSKTEFKEVLSDFLLGMAAGLKKDHVVILRIDGNDLREFLAGSDFESELLSIYSEVGLSEGSLKNYIIKAFEKLSVDHGMPPATDPWVISNIVEPALLSLGLALDQPVSQETFLSEFKQVAENVVQLLMEKPAIVAHSQNTFDGSGIKRLLSNKFELDKTLDMALKSVPGDRHGKIAKEYLSLTLHSLAASAGLPPLGAVDQIDGIMTEALKMFDTGDEKTVKEDEFKNLIAEVLGSIMQQLEGNPISVSVNTVVHEPIDSSSSLLQPSSP